MPAQEAEATEVWFYHLQSQPAERALPALLAKAVAGGWRAVVQLPDEAAVKAMDDLLWTFAEDSFLPHGLAGDAAAARHPVILASGANTADPNGATNLNGASLRVFAGGAMPGEAAGYRRMIVLFDGNDPAALADARTQWSRLKARGLTPTYWQQNEAGGWAKRS